ncbi:carboxypeptidase-like regulatory domain-containing protein [Blastopirellula marina]|uniref:Carboxypeptidase regulatory-like domain-containing protein n=1 Tax=Blastopirellula marina TaxID=124 RepID=A0A2S8GD29_9BACT|nr:carboxypeptidase-like regulatory domain-containing protein [Blastopirellula marina]PQO42365.1 hypothetical protein C5Y93_28960 [Blastopirellula marina]
MRMPQICIPAVLVLFAGCTGRNLPQTFPVTGVVTHKGKPVEGAAVTLVPSGENGRSAGGETDVDGKFSVRTYISPQDQPEGAVPGEYTITVTKLEKRELPEGMKPEEAIRVFRDMGPPKQLLPKNYASPNTSPLKVTIADLAPDPLTLDLVK